MSTPKSKEGANWLVEQIAEKFAQVFRSLAENALKVKPAGATEARGASSPGASILVWTQPLRGIEGASVQVCATESAWLQIGNVILESAGLEPTPEESQSTFTEALTQVFSGVCQELSTRLLREVSLETGAKPQSTSSPPEHDFALRIEQANEADQYLFIQFSAELKDILTPAPQLREKATADAGAKAKTLDLLLDVEMPVSVSFGRAQLPLKDVLKLTSGSIVELNRSIAEPVEIIVNNCVIARGEVVVIEGNYGVRISGIVSRQERLRTLK